LRPSLMLGTHSINCFIARM